MWKRNHHGVEGRVDGKNSKGGVDNKLMDDTIGFIANSMKIEWIDKDCLRKTEDLVPNSVIKIMLKSYKKLKIDTKQVQLRLDAGKD